MNTINAFLTICGLAGLSMGDFLNSNIYIMGLLVIFNIINLIFFIYKAYTNRKYVSIAILMVIGCILVNIKNVFMIINHKKQFCQSCINIDHGQCNLNCGHLRNHCKNKNNKQKIIFILSILHIIGVLITLFALYLFFRKSNNQCIIDNKSCNLHK